MSVTCVQVLLYEGETLKVRPVEKWSACSNKAQRAELKLPLPVGLVYDADQRVVVVDADPQVQQSLRLFFQTFVRTGSAWATVQEFRRQGWRFPRHRHAGAGAIRWQALTEGTALATLHNPC